jgi:hypothetical protein
MSRGSDLGLWQAGPRANRPEPAMMPQDPPGAKHNGRLGAAERVQISDTIIVGTRTMPQSASEEQEFEVVGIVEDEASSTRYAVCYCEASDAFIVTDDGGLLVSDEALAQEILEDFLEHDADDEEDS